MGFERIRYLVIDVDGTMTDGGIYYDEAGNEYKKFCTRDAAGIFAAKASGIHILVVTGRESSATEKRMKELQIEDLFQNVKDKTTFLQTFMTVRGLKKEDIGYIGDDLNDVSSMMLAGYIGCPKDACKEVKAIANYISSVEGGLGAIRDIIEHELESAGIWKTVIQNIYGIGI